MRAHPNFCYWSIPARSEKIAVLYFKQTSLGTEQYYFKTYLWVVASTSHSNGTNCAIQLATSEDIDDENDPEEVIIHSIS